MNKKYIKFKCDKCNKLIPMNTPFITIKRTEENENVLRVYVDPVAYLHDNCYEKHKHEYDVKNP